MVEGEGPAQHFGPEALPLLGHQGPGGPVHPALPHPLHRDCQVAVQLLPQVGRAVLSLALQPLPAATELPGRPAVGVQQCPPPAALLRLSNVANHRLQVPQLAALATQEGEGHLIGSR